MRRAIALALVLSIMPAASLALAGQAPTPAGSAAVRCIPIEEALRPFVPSTQDPRHITVAGASEPPVSYITTVSGAAIDTGRPVAFTLTVKNTGSAPATFTFRTTQRYDVVIWNDDCVEVWRWSRNRVFAQVITSGNVPAGGSSVFRITWNQRDQAGHPVRVEAYEARVVFAGTWAKRSAPLVLPPLIFAVR